MSPPVDDGSLATPILHVDMDAFYVSVMARGRPELRGRPVVVGGGDRGVVLSAGYAARELGVRSGMAMGQARRLVAVHGAELVVLRPDFGVLLPLSRAIMETLRTLTPLVEVASLDEAYLDVRGAALLLGTPLQVAALARARVLAAHGITCSVGVAATCSLAKLGSRLAKPDGVRLIRPDHLVPDVHPLPVELLHGVGGATARLLHDLGVRTVGDLAAAPDPLLRTAFGPHRTALLRSLAEGGGRRWVEPGGAGHFGLGEGEPERSMGAQRTLAVDVADRDELQRHLLALVLRVSARARAAGRRAGVVGVEVRCAGAAARSRERRLHEPTAHAREIEAVARSLLARSLDEVGGAPAVRMLAVRLGDLRRLGPGDSRQAVLGERDPGWREIEQAADAVRDRFGRAALAPATLVPARPARTRPPGWPDDEHGPGVPC